METLTLTPTEALLAQLKVAPFGNKQDLKAELLEQGYDEDEFLDAYEELCCAGVIQEGSNSDGTERYGITSFGEEYSKVYESFEETDLIFSDLKRELEIF
ncbi:MAG: hypothetical protein FWD02_06815 [Bacteroidales bacterium]|nr:hypothetical protein [Bacteroidales bacterium]